MADSRVELRKIVWPNEPAERGMTTLVVFRLPRHIRHFLSGASISRLAWGNAGTTRNKGGLLVALRWLRGSCLLELRAPLAGVLSRRIRRAGIGAAFGENSWFRPRSVEMPGRCERKSERKFYTLLCARAYGMDRTPGILVRDVAEGARFHRGTPEPSPITDTDGDADSASCPRKAV